MSSDSSNSTALSLFSKIVVYLKDGETGAESSSIYWLTPLLPHNSRGWARLNTRNHRINNGKCMLCQIDISLSKSFCIKIKWSFNIYFHQSPPFLKIWQAEKPRGWSWLVHSPNGQLELYQMKARNQKCSAGFLYWWQGSNYLSQFLVAPKVHISRKL